MQGNDVLADPTTFGRLLIGQLNEKDEASPCFKQDGILTLEIGQAILTLVYLKFSGLPGALNLANGQITDGERKTLLGTDVGQSLGYRCRIPVDQLGAEVATELKRRYDNHLAFNLKALVAA